MQTRDFERVLVSLAVLTMACGMTPATVPDGGFDAGLIEEKPALSCSGPLDPLSCPSPGPAPTDPAAITSFVKTSAIPLRCRPDNASAVWDVRPLIELYGPQKVFMVGEVHGTNEIGILSSVLFEQLATQRLVNVLAFEFPMDLGEGLDHYVQTGSDPVASQVFAYFAPNMFSNLLTRTAREVVVKGTPIRLVTVDIPTDTGPAISAIQAVATKLTTQASTVLPTLPTSTTQPPSQEELTRVNAYFDHIMASKAAICAELTAEDCERLVAMTHALWATAFRGAPPDDQVWFARREQVLYYNLKSALPSPSDRLFLHMGSAHTNKAAGSAGSRLAHEYALTRDQVFSVAPAYGDGSVVSFGGDLTLAGEPATLTAALTDAPSDPLFVSTTRPTETCATNPFGVEREGPPGSGTRAESYDGYIHYGKLTSEERPSDTTFSRDIPVVTKKAGAGGAALAQRVRAHLAQVEANERRALEALRRR